MPDTLIAQLYDATLDPTLWSGLATLFAQALDAPSAAISVHNTVTGEIQVYSRTSNFTDETSAVYRRNYAARDVLITRALAQSPGRTITRQEMMDDHEWSEIDIYRNFLSKLGVFQVIGSVFPMMPDQIGIVGIHRPSDAAPFDAASKQRAEPLVAHLQRALRIHQRLRAQDLARAGAQTVMERTGATMLIVDQTGRLLHTTPEADHLLQRSTELTTVSGRVIATQLSANQRLARAIKTATDAARANLAFDDVIVPIPRREGLALSVLVAPFRGPGNVSSPDSAAALLMVRDPQRPLHIIQAVRDLFGLTPTEAHVAAALANGQSLQEIAAINGVTMHTVRSQLKSISLKTGTKRQSDLVALILKSLSGLVA